MDEAWVVTSNHVRDMSAMMLDVVAMVLTAIAYNILAVMPYGRLDRGPGYKPILMKFGTQQ